ncbi:COP9 signalosome complex subunit 1-like [Stegodyphus dumicola]|uniref:COP9 signalosome complex subunit 1-like n=1 Tax=Stegodyphus dumicola TaxID=202533 RepID=UPI0015AA2F32|nr:COP9 signalosome complex subunit 1-like [Stegodyphus dumicola]
MVNGNRNEEVGLTFCEKHHCKAVTALGSLFVSKMPLPVQVSLGLFQSSVEPMQVDAPPDENDTSEEEVYIVENPTL